MVTLLSICYFHIVIHLVPLWYDRCLPQRIRRYQITKHKIYLVICCTSTAIWNINFALPKRQINRETTVWGMWRLVFKTNINHSHCCCWRFMWKMCLGKLSMDMWSVTRSLPLCTSWHNIHCVQWVSLTLWNLPRNLYESKDVSRSSCVISCKLIKVERI